MNELTALVTVQGRENVELRGKVSTEENERSMLELLAETIRINKELQSSNKLLQLSNQQLVESNQQLVSTNEDTVRRLTGLESQYNQLHLENLKNERRIEAYKSENQKLRERVDKLFQDQPRLAGTSGSGSGKDDEEEEEDKDEDDEEDDDDDEGSDDDNDDDGDGDGVGKDGGDGMGESGAGSSSGAQERDAKREHDPKGKDPKGGSSTEWESTADALKRSKDYIQTGSVPLDVVEPLRNLFLYEDEGNLRTIPLPLEDLEEGEIPPELSREDMKTIYGLTLGESSSASHTPPELDPRHNEVEMEDITHEVYLEYCFDKDSTGIPDIDEDILNNSEEKLHFDPTPIPDEVISRTKRIMRLCSHWYPSVAERTMKKGPEQAIVFK